MISLMFKLIFGILGFILGIIWFLMKAWVVSMLAFFGFIAALLIF